MLRIALFALGIAVLAFGKEDPVSWTLSPVDNHANVAPGSKAYLELKGTIEPGWHLYSPTTPPGGPIITKIALSSSPAVSSYQFHPPEPVRKLDPNLNITPKPYPRAARSFFEVQTAQTAAGSAPV